MSRKKRSKEAVGYEPVAKNHDDRCGLCTHFMPLYGMCHKVLGRVVPNGWCTLFEAKNARPRG